MFVVFKMIFSRKPIDTCSHLSYIPSILISVRRSMDENAGNIRAPKRAGGQTKNHNNCEGLSEDVIIAKNLRTSPNSSDEDQKMRDNRLQ